MDKGFNAPSIYKQTSVSFIVQEELFFLKPEVLYFCITIVIEPNRNIINQPKNQNIGTFKRSIKR